MTPEQLAKMQAGRLAAQAAKKLETARIQDDDTAAWQERHERARADLLRNRKWTS